MKREDFIKIIRLRSFWKIDRRTGDYKLSSGKSLSSYIMDLVESQMKLDSFGIRKDGNLCFCEGGSWNAAEKRFDDYTLVIPFKNNETCSVYDMEARIRKLVREIVGC